MRVVVQRVARASVTTDEGVIGEIGIGLLVLLGVFQEDKEEDCLWLVERLKKLRVFDDEDGKMNRSVVDVDGSALVVSQFTLFGSMKKGTRPSYNRAATPDIAVPLYKYFIKEMSAVLGKDVASGAFGASMEVELVNDGPVTLILDSRNRDF